MAVKEEKRKYENENESRKSQSLTSGWITTSCVATSLGHDIAPGWTAWQLKCPHEWPLEHATSGPATINTSTINRQMAML